MSVEETNVGSEVTVKFDKDGYAGYMQWVADTRKRNVASKLKEAGVKVVGRRQTLVMRRMKAKIMEIAPDEDIAAYGEIHKLKNPSGNPKNKIFVTDNEIAAYRGLDPDFKVAPALEDVAAMIEVMIESGELSTEGNVVADDDEDGDDGGTGAE